jgi:hypothetical protein
VHEKGVVAIPILAVLAIIAVGSIVALFSISREHVNDINLPSSEPNSRKINFSDIFNDATQPASNAPSSDKPSTTPSPTPKANNITQDTTQTQTPSPTQKPYSCEINTSANEINSMALNLVYGANYQSGNNYVTGVQWDFDGNGSWDTDMAIANGNISHTYPSPGNYTVKMQLQMSDGGFTDVCSKSVTLPQGVTVSLTGQVYSDENCNDTQEPNEPGIANVTVNIFRYPENSLYTTVTSDSSGNYNLTRNINSGDGLSIIPGDVAAPYYKIFFDRHPITLNSVQSSINQNLPQVPAANTEQCF